MTTQTLIQLLPLVLLIVIMYFLLIRPQKKRERTITQMRNNLSIGDEIITIGGICGRIVKIKEETLTIEVGTDKTKFEVMRWAISKVTSTKTKPVADTTAKPAQKSGKVKRPNDKKAELAEKATEVDVTEEASAPVEATDVVSENSEEQK